MDAKAFLDRVRSFESDGYRLLMINATALGSSPSPSPSSPSSDAKHDAEDDDDGAVELTWSFEKSGRLEHLREQVKPGEEVPSVSAIYPFSYLYENEVRELFGVKVTGLSVDFKGQLYQTSTKVPFSPKAIRARLDAQKGKKP